MLLHYLGKLKIHFFAHVEEHAYRLQFLIAFNFVIHPQIFIFLVLKIASLSPY